MANIKKNPLAPKKKKKVPTKECLGCHEEKKLTEFYQASNPLTSTDGKKVNLPVKSSIQLPPYLNTSSNSSLNIFSKRRIKSVFLFSSRFIMFVKASARNSLALLAAYSP